MAFLLLLLLLTSPAFVRSQTEEESARVFLQEFDIKAQELYYEYALADWEYNTNITDFNAQASSVKAAQWSEFYSNKSVEARRYDLAQITNRTVKQQLELLGEQGSGALSPDKYAQLNEVMGSMSNIYSTSKICSPLDPNKCFRLDPELDELMATSLDYAERLWAWEGWHSEVGKRMRPLYERYVVLKNEVATLNGYEDYGDYWRGNYEVKAEFGGTEYAYSRSQLLEEVQTLYNTVEPLYKELHAYVRRKLRDQYGSKVDLTAGIPAHLLGDMWGRFWTNLNSLATPYPDKPSIDVTPQMIANGWKVKRMFESADDFFQSIGLQRMNDAFWNHSMLVRPDDGREVVCHPTAWDMGNGNDFRIKMCSDVNMDDFLTAHHEMGHLQYDMEYAPLTWLLRDGANEGFHEAVGEIMSLSAATPEHLGKLGLLPPGFTEDAETDINFLLKQALTIVATMPFTLSLEQWRWKVFSGEIPHSEWMKTWWKMKREVVGVMEPVFHNEEYCDPAALFHVANDYSFIRYYTRTILQFQFQEALCKAAGKTGPLYKCDIHNSKEAGRKLMSMLKLGKAESWTKALEQIASTTKMDSKPFINYFEPLYKWLQEDNRKHGQMVGWDPNWMPYMNDAMKVRISLKAEMGEDAYTWDQSERYLFRSVTAYAMRKYSLEHRQEVEYNVDHVLIFRETPRVSFYFVVQRPENTSEVVALAEVEAAVRASRHRYNRAFLLSDATLEFVGVAPSLAPPPAPPFTVWLLVFGIVLGIVVIAFVVLIVLGQLARRKMKQQAMGGVDDDVESLERVSQGDRNHHNSEMNQAALPMETRGAAYTAETNSRSGSADDEETRKGRGNNSCSDSGGGERNEALARDEDDGDSNQLRTQL